MPLTAAAIKNAKAKSAAYKLYDRDGLYLLIAPTGGKLWRFKYRYDGKEKLLALGPYPEISLNDARTLRSEAREQVAKGVDPGETKKRAKQARMHSIGGTFEAVARAWWQQWRPTRTERHANYVIRRLEDNAFPTIGNRPVKDLQAPEFVALLKGIEARGALDIAKRTHQMCSQVMRFAVAHGLATRNPVADFRPGDVIAARKKENYARLDAKEFPELLRKIDAYEGAITTRYALQLMALTFVRTGELIGARWAEIDFDAAEWRIPAERMKMRTPHIVPLAKQTLALLRELHQHTSNRDYVFPGEANPRKHISNNTILYALYRLGYHSRMTGHGFRGMASTILHELGLRHDWIELQLAHQERDDVSAAYNHATYLKERRKMMQQWADHLDALRKQGKVIPMATGARKASA